MSTAPFEVHSATSEAAADSLSTETLARLEAVVFATIRRSRDYGKTDAELETWCRLSHQTASARRRALVQKGLVRDSGRVRPTSTGRNATVWVVGAQAYVEPGHAQPSKCPLCGRR